jgi:phosphoribosylformimino-5-aminoimidazole carboxamide ribotide isomerase
MDTFHVIPAIDVLDGRCVRLSEGRREHVTIEGGDPAAAAARFAAEGASWLHVVDLDGAFSGRPTPGLVEQVVGASRIPVQFGGGLRDADAIQAALDAGAGRVTIGSAALTAVTGLSLSLLSARFGERLVVAVDARNGRVVRNGWTAETGVTPRELARACADAGIHRLLVTSTRRDEAGVPVLAAGGIASLDDLVTLRELGCEGAVVGSALWSGRFTLTDALSLGSDPAGV